MVAVLPTHNLSDNVICIQTANSYLEKSASILQPSFDAYFFGSTWLADAPPLVQKRSDSYLVHTNSQQISG
jgi:hypothetical protein